MEEEKKEIIKEVEEEIRKYEIQQGLVISNLIYKLIKYTCDKLEQTFEAPLELILEFLNENPDLLKYDLIDKELDKLSMPIKIALNSAVKVLGAIVKTKGWKKELLENGNDLILAVVKKYDPQLYEMLKDKQNLLNFIKSYIIYKLGI